MIKEITLKELKEKYPVAILFFNGKSFLAKKIKLFQKWRFYKSYKTQFGEQTAKLLINLNHVGLFVLTQDNTYLIYEQDNPGRFQPSLLTEEYLKPKKEIYVGVSESLNYKKGQENLRHECRKLAGKDVLLNYSFGSYFGFIKDTFKYIIKGKDVYTMPKPKKGKSTCSQIVAKLLQKCFGILRLFKWWEWFPCQIAADKQIKIYKLIY